tara:strand:- start:45 stop:527 length:483 start_codon:yes stop_codon:yes gene_type:complete
MADKYTLTPQEEGVYRGEPTKTVKIIDWLKGKRRWPEGRNIGEDHWDWKEAGKLGGQSGTYVRQEEDTMDERNKFANRSERFQTKTDYDRRRIAYAENKFQEIINSTDSGKVRESYRYNKDDYIRKFLDEFDRLSLLEGERMAQGGIVSLNQLTQPIGYR